MVKVNVGPPYKGESVHFHTVMIDGFVHIQASGKLTYGHEAEAREQLQHIAGSGIGYLLDLTCLALIDSTGFGVLIQFQKMIASSDPPNPHNRVVMIVQDELQKELIAIAKLDQLFPVCASIGEALERLKAMGAEDNA